MDSATYMPIETTDEPQQASGWQDVEELEGSLLDGNDLIAGIPVHIDNVDDSPQILSHISIEEIDEDARRFAATPHIGLPHVLVHPLDRLTARRLAVSAAVLLLRNGAASHYTEGPERWEGIKRKLRAIKGQFPKKADCSSSLTWYMWTATRAWSLWDFVNGAKWLQGYTGTMVNHGERVTDGHYLLADTAIYGDPFGATGHTAILCGTDHNGSPLVISNGSEAGPFLLPLNYRDDLLEVRRYIV
jgi:hypothetical protein